MFVIVWCAQQQGNLNVKIDKFREIRQLMHDLTKFTRRRKLSNG